MKTFKTLFASLVLISLLTTLCGAQNLNWYPFDRDFIEAKYSTSAIGDLSFKKSHAAQKVTNHFF